MREAATRVLGAPPREVGVSFWMDAALFEAAEITSVNFGGHGGGEHEAVEWVSLSSIVSCARVLESAALAYLGGAAL